MGLHHISVIAPAHAGDDMAQRLTAEINDPPHLNASGVNIQPGLTGKAQQGFIVIVSLVLHTGGKRNHSQIVSVGDGIDVTGESQGILSEGDALRKSSPCCGALGTHGRSPRRLTDCGNSFPAAFPKPLYQTYGCGGFAFSQRSRSNGGHINIFSVGRVFKTTHDCVCIDFPHEVPIGKQLSAFQAESASDFIYVRHVFFSIQRDFPVGKTFRIKSHAPYLRRIPAGRTPVWVRVQYGALRPALLPDKTARPYMIWRTLAMLESSCVPRWRLRRACF